MRLLQRPTTENSNMAAQTGSTYISGTVKDSAEIPTASLGFSTMTSSKKVLSNDFQRRQTTGNSIMAD